MLVTGASSFVGTHVSESLASLGHEVIRTFRRHNERILNLSDYSPVEMNQLDFSCLAYLMQLASDFDAIVHNASSSPSVDVDVNSVMVRNVLGTLNLRNWLKWQKSITLIVTYSPYVCGNIFNQILIEKMPTNSCEIYGSSKLASVHLITQIAVYENKLIIRFPIVLGNHVHRRSIPRRVESFQTNSAFEITNPNKLYYSMTTLTAVASFANHFLISNLNGKHITNFWAEEPLTVLQIAKFLKTCLKSNSVIEVNEAETNC